MDFTSQRYLGVLCSSFCVADPGQTDNIGVCSAKAFRACSRYRTVSIALCFAGIRDGIADENIEVYGNGQNTDMLPPLIFKDNVTNTEDSVVFVSY